ncbi:MAG: hypothetical protein RLO52_10905 [Sandaracinaceae bacterium]|nr:MAG: hypothetical protein EVA89_38400 [Sandaracinaceae bacterium]HBQ15095.1 hypothetical protein [Myxococcales bacterium]
MAIQIVPHTEERKPLVEAFNAKMHGGGSQYGFYVEPTPRWIPKREGQKVWRELYLAVRSGKDGDQEVVGGYALKPQVWLVDGQEHLVADWQGPFSLGAIDNKYAAMGLRMVRDMLKKQPLIYSWGHGGEDEPIVRMLRKMGWLLHETPFLFRICKPKNFLTKNAYLREDGKKALAQDFLAYSGLGFLGLHTMHAALRVRSLKLRFEAQSEVVPQLGPWADELWEKAKDAYRAIAVRDADTMNALASPQHDHDEWPEPVRLRVRKDGRDIGWAIVLERQQKGNARFGDMRMGMIADYFAHPDDAAEVIHAAFAHLRDLGVDMVMANQSHPKWIAGFEDAGFLKVDKRRIFCASPELEKVLKPWTETREGLFLSNMDGHGPMGI